jgi:hypothetical protein
MSRRVFSIPIPWGLGPGPERLYSIGGAVRAVDMWLQVTPVFPELRGERERMWNLRDLLLAMPEHVTKADLESAALIIQGMVTYANSREAEDARIAAYDAHRAA